MTDPSDIRPRRSALYMPGSKARALEKARTLAADCLILDLEDAVTPAEKPAARSLVVDALKAGGYGQRELVVRINGLDTPWGADDLAAVAPVGPDAVLVPKVESAAGMQDIAAALAQHGAPERTRIWAMMETPRAMLDADLIAAASPRLGCFVMGTNDLVKELNAAHTPLRLPVITGLGLCMLAARAHGLAILDGVYNAYLDDDGLRESCVQGREMGFDGKTLIHPAQLGVTNDVFAPSVEDLDLARRYIDAFEETVSAGGGVAVVDGKIVENLHVETARRQLAQAAAIAAMEKEMAT